MAPREPSARLPATRLLFIVAFTALAACSFLAPTDQELTGGPQQHPPASEGPDASAGSSGRPATSSAGGTDELVSTAGQAGEGGQIDESSLAEGGASAGEGGAAGAAPTPLLCDGTHADCNGLRSDGCETDLTANTSCGGCGINFTCASGTQCLAQRCVSVSGCSDGTRDGFTSVDSYKTVAGCAANWPLASLLSAKQGGTCGADSNDCQVPADACGAYWHVCGATAAGGTEVSNRLSPQECNSRANPGEFVIAVGDQRCACTAEGDGAACCGADCVQQNGNCIYPNQTAWYGVVNNYKNVCGAIQSLATTPEPHGVLCCRDTP